MGRFRVGGAAAIAAAATTTSVFAQDAPGAALAQASNRVQPMPTVEVSAGRLVRSLDDPVTTATRLGLTPRETPASVEQIDGDLIRERGDATVMSAVTRATGIFADGTPGDGGTALSARGFAGHNSVMQLYDGARMYVGAGTVTFPFDTWSIRRVEVLLGPASVMGGEGAIGGVINVVPKKPSPMPSAEVLATYGAQKTSQVAFDLAGPFGEQLSYRVSASHRGSDGYVDRGDSRSLALSGALHLEAAPDLAFTLSYDTGDQKPTRYFGGPLVDGHFEERFRRANFNVGDADIRFKDQWGRLAADWRISPGATLTSTFTHLANQRHWKNAEIYFWNAGLIDRADYLEIFHDQSQSGNRTALSLTGNVLGRRNDAVVGFDLNDIRFQHDNNFAVSGESTVDPDPFDPGLFIVPSGTVPAFRTRTKQVAAFAEDRLFVTREWSWVGGVRADRINFHRDNLVNGTTYDTRFSATSWRIGTVYSVSPGAALYAQYVTGSDPVGSIITLSPTRAAFDLSKGEQWEAGLKQGFAGKRGEWTLAAYRIVKQKLLTNAPGQPGVTLQVGRQSSRGVEASVRLALPDALSVHVNGTVLRARFDDFFEETDDGLVSRSGNVPPEVARKLVNAGFSWRPVSAWDVGADFRYVGKRFGDIANQRVLPAYGVVDARVRWQVSRSVNLALNLFNAFDKLYTAAPYNSGGQWILGRPRSLELSALVSF